MHLVIHYFTTSFTVY